jgi:two-component system chemotaxis response regulator CheY
MAYNILIVDDSRTTRRVIAKTLDLAGVPVGDLYQAANGREALEVLHDHWVDVVFSDLNMPEMSGLEMIKRMAADEALSAVPVVVISTEGSSERIEELKRQGIRAYIRKPFQPEQIRDVVREVLGVEVEHDN